MQFVDIAIFAHNEQEQISRLLEDLSQQTLLADADTRLRIRVLCNGCSDDTFAVAEAAVSRLPELRAVCDVRDLPQPGKSRTWNAFVDQLPPDSDFVVFVDGDIQLRDTNALLHLIEDLRGDSAVAITSRPQKDTQSLRRRPLLRFIAESVGRVHRDGPIAGSLYAVKTAAIRNVRLPVPCLTEDAFLSACLVTGIFSHEGRPALVKASSRVSHWFKTPETLRQFFAHDVRIAVGTELNAALFSTLWEAESNEQRYQLLSRFSESSGIEESIVEHLRHPDRSSLKFRFALLRLFRRGNRSFISHIIHFPLRLVHFIYVLLVNNLARRKFQERRFQW